MRAAPGTIGYLALSELTAGDLEGVRVLGLDTGAGVLRPGEPGYPLRFRAPPEPRR